jgi:predicted methyltransferase
MVMSAQCACQRTAGIDLAGEEPVTRVDQGPAAPRRSETELIEMYRRGDLGLRLSLYMQHRDLRGVFALLEQEEP